MVKLIFKAYKKIIKYFFTIFFPIYKNVNRILSKKTKRGFHKRLVKDTKIFLMKKATKTTNMLAGDIEIFLKKKKKRSVNMVVSDIKIF